MSARRHARPARGERWSSYGLFAALWASGGALALLQWWLRPVGPFGPVLHPAEPAVRTLHGVLAVPALFGLGWMAARHVSHGLRSNRPRALGPLLLASLATLAVSGYALYDLTDDRSRALTGVGHAALGALALVPALVHWLRRRR